MQLVKPKTTDSGQKAKRSWLNALPKIVVSVVLLAIIYRSVKLGKLYSSLQNVHLSTAIILCFLYAVSQFISSTKWQLILEHCKIKRSFPEVIRAYFLGMFVNLVGIGTVGGDVARALFLKPEKGETATLLSTVIVDRVHGLLALFAIGVTALNIMDHPLLPDYLDIASLFLLGVLLVCWWVGPTLVLRVFPAEHRFAREALAFSSAFPRNPKRLFQITFISVLFHCLQIYMHFMVSNELKAGLTLSFLFAVVPLINIASSLPISINGLGVREWMYTFLFSFALIPFETSVAFGALWFAIVTIVSVLSGVVVPILWKLYTTATAKDSQTNEEIVDGTPSEGPISYRQAGN